jgi:ribosomal protein S18 acetylase RimI-like enzyme
MERDTVAMRLHLDHLHPFTLPVPTTLIRTVMRDDLPALGKVMYQAYEGTVEDEGESELDALGEIEGTTDGKYGKFDRAASLVAQIDNAPVSSSLVTSWHGFPLLAFTVTLPEWQRRGIGGRLIFRSAELLASQGHRELRLMVTRANPAINLYRKLGFLECDTRPR